MAKACSKTRSNTSLDRSCSGKTRHRERSAYFNKNGSESNGNDGKGRVLGGRADQNELAGLHVREKNILLVLAEPVDFVEKQDRGCFGAEKNLVAFVQHGADLLEVACAAGERFKRTRRLF